RGDLTNERWRGRRSDRTCNVAPRRTTVALHVDQNIVQAVLAWDSCRKTRRSSVRAGHAGIAGSALPARIGRTCLCRRDFTGHRLGTTGPIAACSAHQIDVDMIVVRGVVAGREHGRKVIAGRKMDVAQEALLFRRPMPSVLYGNPTAVRQGESGDVERV